MGKITGFMEHTREMPQYEKPADRVKHWKEFYKPFAADKIKNQAARCMDCGIPFCHSGCPLGNVIPEFNDAVYRNNWKVAFEILSSTNNFPEFTGRICPAPCEDSCVLSINNKPVTIENIEKHIAEKAHEEGYYNANPPKFRTGKRVAVVGSGPSGLAAADQLNKAGHWVVVFERDDRVGGLLRYGIPDFKLEKRVIDRRVKIMQQEGVAFKTNANVGVNVQPDYLLSEFDAVVLCGGSTIPRNINIPGRELKGVYFAMEFLKQQNKRNAGDKISDDQAILATGKNVIVIGGGDTGSDCVGTSNRHGAKSVNQLEVLPKPPANRRASNPWPQWGLVLRTSSSHDEGCNRQWSINVKEFVGDDKGNLKGLKVSDFEWYTDANGKQASREVAGSEREMPAELILLAAGFLHPQHEGMLKQLGIELDERGNVKTRNHQTSNPKVFSAGDMRRGQSLVVWAISEGREAARAVDLYLNNDTTLQSKDRSLVNVLSV